MTAVKLNYSGVRTRILSIESFISREVATYNMHMLVNYVFYVFAYINAGYEVFVERH